MTRIHRNLLRRRRLVNTSPALPSASEIAHFNSVWLNLCDAALRRGRRERFGILLDAHAETMGRADPDKTFADRAARENLRSLKRQMIEVAGETRLRPNALDRRLDWLMHALGLDKAERAILGVLTRVELFSCWEEMFDVLTPHSRLDSHLMGMATGLSRQIVAARRSKRGALVAHDLAEAYDDDSWNAGDLLKRIARTTLPAGQSLARDLLPVAPCSTLAWSDFDHLPEARTLADRLVASGKGCSILLYGPPGTGKSEFARLLADRHVKAAIFVGTDDGKNDEPSREQRLGHLMLARALTSKDPDKVLVVDEADDVLYHFSLDGKGQRSKLWINTLVENCKRPTIWIVNDPAVLDETIIRRMDLALAFDKPPRSVRRRIVERHARQERISLASEDLDTMANLPAAPAVIGRALRSASLIRGGGAEAVLAAEGLVEAITSRPVEPYLAPSAYDPALSVADTDLAVLADRLVSAPARGWSLLLSGPSGTGKSAFGRHLADRLSIEVLERRGSDLLGMFVGETEANIAHAFREASRSGSLLLIDEADDFLTDRRDAVRSWERTMVAEMLRWMERLGAPFVATTNLSDRLDPATQRRFTLHARFEALDEARSATLFARYFGAALPAGARLSNQTPGDFAQVAHRAGLLGETDLSIIVRWLRGEAEAREGGRSEMGFAV